MGTGGLKLAGAQLSILDFCGPVAADAETTEQWCACVCVCECAPVCLCVCARVCVRECAPVCVWLYSHRQPLGPGQRSPWS